MTDLFDSTMTSYKVIIAPFLMMTSSATLVWALQNRFSRIVHAIRTLISEGKRDNIDYTHSLAKQISWLKGRSYLLRNSIVGFYFAMCCFLLSTMLLALGILGGFPLAIAAIASFLIGLIVICCSLAFVLLETARSYDSLAEEVSKR